MLKLEHVSKVYRTADVRTAALDDVSLEVPQGQFLAIMGPSGSEVDASEYPRVD